MSKPWTYQEDHMLLRFGDALGLNQICGHDIDRTVAAARARRKKLDETGATKSFALSLCHLMQYRIKSGQIVSEIDRMMMEPELDHWEYLASTSPKK